MKKVKQVNIVFMMSALMPYMVLIIMELTGFRFANSLQQILVSQLIYVLPAIVYLAVCGMKPSQALRIKKVKVSNVFLLILFAYLITPLTSLINAFSMIFAKNEIAGTINGITENFPLVVGVLTVGLLPAIFEETVYRGVLYNEYRKANPKIAVFLSALLFGLLHQNLNQFMYAFVLGLIFALVIEATDSIISTMIIHFVINSTSIVLNYALPRALKVLEQLYGSDVFNADSLYDTAETVDKVTMIQSAYVMLIPAIISTILAFLVYRTIAKNTDRYEEVKKIFGRSEGHERFSGIISIPLILGAGICIYNIIYNLLA